MALDLLSPPDGAPVEPPPGASRITHERGPMTRQVRAAALAEGGEPAWEDLLASVSPTCRDRFRKPIGYFEWVESELALELHHAWITRKGEEFMAQRGADAAREILNGAQSWILRLATPSLLIQSMPRLFHFYYRGGELRVVSMEAGAARLELHASGYFPSWYRDALPAWAMEALRLTGLKDLKVDYLPPPPGLPDVHGYDLRWRP
ncbi:MAG TPA: hypothetical protein VJ623_12570 [Holophagaceae bacterium]|nr:hypothetical protein [Holophagaceae bacterium]